MKVFVQRVSRDSKYWKIRFSAAGTNAFTGNLITTVTITTNLRLLDAFNKGADQARQNFKDMREFNAANDQS